ncbi:MAG: ATP-binding protein, partial [Thermoplasmata archaeon]
THDRLARAIEETLPRRAPNLSALLGPDLAARLLARAGGLARLSRLPAGTIQVLGAERAFFEHLRGRAPPPRHGLLFLHPRIQSAPRSERGKLARALAGKAAIAARLDASGAPIRPDLRAAFDARATQVRSQRLARRAPPNRR